MNGKRVLILGGGTMQLPAIRTSLSRGWMVSVADGNPEAPGAALCHLFLPVDLRDVEGMIEAARSVKEKEGLDGVFTAGTDFSYTVAAVAEALELPGIPPEAARAASDKVRMREVLYAHGISVPDFVKLDAEDEVRTRVETLSFPLVVKPVDNMGGRGVKRVDTCMELEEAVSEAQGNSHSGRVIVEEYVEGPEFSIDALVERGRVHITGFADRIIRFSPFFVEMGHTLPTEIEPSLRGRIESTFVLAVEALGITEGAAKGDIKWTGREVVVGEVAARLSGGYMSGWTFPYATGIDLSGAALNIAVGLPAGDLEPEWERISAERAFISIPGTVESLEGEEEVREMESIEELFVRIASGDVVRFPTNNVEKCGNVIAVNEHRERACAAAEEATSRLWVHLQPADWRTERFLYRREQGWLEDAFSLRVPGNHAAYSKMGPFARIPGGEREITVAPLPSLELEDAMDWHGNGVAETAERALAFTCCRFSSGGADGVDLQQSGGVGRSGAAGAVQQQTDGVVLGSVFWTALLRGGLQGAVWSIETVCQLLEEGRDLQSWWEGVAAAGKKKEKLHGGTA